MRLRRTTHPRPARSLRRTAAASAGAVLLLAPLAACSDDSGAGSAADSEPGSDSSADSGEDAGGTGVECDYPADGSEPAREVEAPPAQAQDDGEVLATLALGQGDVGLELDAAKTPCTVNSFTALAEQGYFDDTPCHRLTTQGIYVLQCGDPTGTGTGGPGYSFADEVDGSETYPAGTVAMANAGPDTNGSQFFLVYEDSQLPPAYTVFGTMDAEGLDIVDDIAAVGAEGGAPDGPPAEEVTIEGVTVE